MGASSYAHLPRLPRLMRRACDRSIDCHRAQATAPILDYLLRTKGTLPLGRRWRISTFFPFCAWLLPVEADTESLGAPRVRRGLVSRTADKAKPASCVTHPSRLWPGKLIQFVKQ
jgi:hypothetical protein